MGPMGFHLVISLAFIILLTLPLAFHSFVSSARIPAGRKDKLLVISLDGFRWNYLERTNTPNFDWITKHGVRASKGLTNAFITKTFPNHFTLVTGQWEETHGIIANSMYDPLLNSSFSPKDALANSEAAWFDQGGEPIWVTNQLQRKDGKTGVIMWVGGGAPVKNVLPTKFMAFDRDVKNETKIDTIIEWFQDGINLGLVYFRQPDAFGHLYGPESEQVTRMIGGLDELVGYLLKRLRNEEMLDDINIIITSDHGFTSTPEDKIIDVSNVLDLDTFLMKGATPIAGIWPHPGFHDEIYNNLTEFANTVGHFTVYKKEDIPAHFHYRLNRRTPPIVAVADNHYSFSAGEPWHLKGNHGYDNRLQDMHPFFVATGPAFKSDFTVETFHSVDVYPLMCHILGLIPAANNGSMEVVGTFLADTNISHEKASDATSFWDKEHIKGLVIGGIILVGLGTVTFVIVTIWRKKRKQQESASSVIMDDVEVTNQEPEGKLPPSYGIGMSNTPLLQDQEF